ncbi:MAG: hypothetical protein WC314_24270 [Vulcanimicrobiota bacterium]
MRARGHTLVEILVASFLAVVVAIAVVRVFWFGRGVERQARSSYLIRQDADVAFRQLQSELRLTHLASIRLHTDDNGWGMASPLLGGFDKESFEFSKYGVAVWKSWVHFSVVPTDENVGTLVRWEVPYRKGPNLPLPPPSLENTPSESKWSIMPRVVLPGRGPVADSSGLQTFGAVEKGGGLQLRFLRSENDQDTLSAINPSAYSDTDQYGWTAGSTELVDLKLQVGEVSGESGKLSLYTLNLRIKPRN